MNKPLEREIDPPVEAIVPRPGAADGAPKSVPIWSSEQLLEGSHEARIVHHGEEYRLLLTRNQKLILVK